MYCCRVRAKSHGFRNLKKNDVSNGPKEETRVTASFLHFDIRF
jgi:hypothetical protein